MNDSKLAESYFHKCHHLMNQLSDLKKRNMALELENHEYRNVLRKYDIDSVEKLDRILFEQRVW